MSSKIILSQTRPRQTVRLSNDGQWTNFLVSPSFWSKTVQNIPPMDLDKCVFMVSIDAPLIDTRSVDSTRLCTLPFCSFFPNCKGPPQGLFVGTWRVIPRRLDYKLTLIRVRHHSTKYHHFSTPKT